ncbi:MAG: lipoyl(octanoyl) transferase LipB [Alphaproteobacteria bacterium]|nr:lipoyl(octanoyl) transferase LipB [Alphaproteobacteria bacterium]
MVYDEPMQTASLPTGHSIEWTVSAAPVPYANAMAAMEERVGDIIDGAAREKVWLLEHPPLYTAGTSADPAELLNPNGMPVFQTGRGGRYTYHGPGQRIAYVMMDLRRRHGACGPDLRGYISDLEEWVIASLADCGVVSGRRKGRIGIWVNHAGNEEKIAAIGVRVRRWVTFHGVAINVAPNLAHFRGIVPCGIREHGVTSLAALGRDTGRSVSMAELDAALRRNWDEVFAPRAGMPAAAGTGEPEALQTA